MPTEEEIKIKITADTSEFKKGMKDAAKATEDLSGSGNGKGINSSMKEASKSAEKIKGEFAGVKKETAKSGGFFGKAFDGLKDAFAKMGASSKLAAAGAAGVIVAAVGLVGKILIDTFKKIMQFSGQMTKMYNPAGFEKATSKMNESLTRMKTSLGAVLEPLYKAITAIVGWLADAFNGILETVLRIYAAFVGFIGLSGTLSRNAEEYSDSMEEAAASADAGLSAFDKINTLNTDGMGDASQSQRIRDLMADAAESGDHLRNSIFEALNPMKWIGEAFKALGLESTWNSFVDAGRSAWQFIVNYGVSAWNGIKDAFTTIWSGIGDLFTNIWNGVKNAGINVFNSLRSAFGNIFSGINFGGVFNGLRDGFRNVLNGIIDLWNNSIANIGWEVDIFGQKFGINTYGLKLPKFATGGVVKPNDPFMAILGDNTREKEIVSPESTMEGVVRRVLNENNEQGKKSIELTVNLDGRKIARGIYDYVTGEAKRRGDMQ